jgi:hypothetical protein
MQFTVIVAAVLSMAAFAIAAPIGTIILQSIFNQKALTNCRIEVEARQVAATGNHGMCVKSTAGALEQITC